MDHTQSENLGLSASGLMRVSDPTIPLPFGLVSAVPETKIFHLNMRPKLIAGNVFCMPFFDGLRTVKCSLRRHQNCVVGEKRGDGGSVVVVVCLLKLLSLGT